MADMKEKHKYAYLKNGDVVEQVLRVLPKLDDHNNSGPDAFIASFLRLTSDSKVLLLSYAHRSNKFQSENIYARAYKCVYRSIVPWRIIQTTIKRGYVFVDVLVRLILFRPDRIVCGRQGLMLWSAYFASKILAKPLVHSRHASVIQKQKSVISKLNIAIDSWIIRRIHASVCHGPFTKQQLINEGVDIDKIYEFDVGFEEMTKNCTDTNLLVDISQNGANDIILYVGRMTESKGIFDLFDASKSLLKEKENLRLVYIGSGKDFNQLKDKITAQELSDKIILLGNVPHNELAGIYKQSTISVTPTLHAREARCMAAMEALVMGTPVISPNGGAFPYLIKDNYNGLLYEVDSVIDLRDKIKRVITDKTTYDQLKSGAIESGKKLMIPNYTFAQAIDKAFSNN